MLNKIKSNINHLIYIIFTNTIYGIILFYTVTFSAQYSLLLAYFINLVFIILGLSLDEVTKRKVLDPKYMKASIERSTNEAQKQAEYRFIKWMLKSFVSFKTSLFFFYIFILILSQVVRFNPGFFSDSIANFISTIDYSVIILLALKDFGEEFAKDRKVMKQSEENFDRYFEK